ncbi:hypothetical protein CCP2SC5_140046 [Azospirillaceae bacterium]
MAEPQDALTQASQSPIPQTPASQSHIDWTAPPQFLESLAVGQGGAQAMESVQGQIAEQLQKAGVSPETAATVVRSLAAQVVETLAQGGSMNFSFAVPREIESGSSDAAQTGKPSSLEQTASQLMQALALGDVAGFNAVKQTLSADPALQAVGVEALQTALKAGVSPEAALKQASDAIVTMTHALQTSAVAQSPQAAALMALASGGESVAASIQTLTAGLSATQSDSFVDALFRALSDQTDPISALTAANQAAQASQSQTVSGVVALTASGQLLNILSSGGDVDAALTAAGIGPRDSASGGAIAALTDSLSQGADGAGALSTALVAAQAETAFRNAAAGPVDPLLAALSGAGDLSAMLGGAGAGNQAAFLQALSDALADGVAPSNAMAAVNTAILSQSAAARSSGGGAQGIMAALASGEGVGAALGNASEAFVQGLEQALASGANTQTALAAAAASESASQSQSSQASQGVPPPDPQLLASSGAGGNSSTLSASSSNVSSSSPSSPSSPSSSDSANANPSAESQSSASSESPSAVNSPASNSPAANSPAANSPTANTPGGSPNTGSPPDFNAGASVTITSNDASSPPPPLPPSDDSGTPSPTETNTNTNTETLPTPPPPVNIAPILTAGGTSTYTENDAASVIDGAVTIRDVDDVQMSGAVISISSGFTAGDILGVTSQNGISASYNGGLGVLTLSGTASLAAYQETLRSVTFYNSGDAPTEVSATRSISWTVTDTNASRSVGGVETSSGAISIVVVNALNDAPIATGAAVFIAVAGATSPPVATVAEIFSSHFSDAADGPDASSIAGIAIAGQSTPANQGLWEYSINGGEYWGAVPDTLTDTFALTLNNDALIRFTPTSGWHGTTAPMSIRLLETGGDVLNNGIVDVSGANNGEATHVSSAVIPFYASVVQSSLSESVAYHSAGLGDDGVRSDGKSDATTVSGDKSFAPSANNAVFNADADASSVPHSIAPPESAVHTESANDGGRDGEGEHNNGSHDDHNQTALAFDGDDAVVTAHGLDAGPLTAITFEAWIKPDAHQNGDAVGLIDIMRDVDATRRDGFCLNLTQDGALSFEASQGDSAKILHASSESESLFDGQWRHVAAVYNVEVDMGHMALYLDGRAIGALSWAPGVNGPAAIASSETSLHFGDNGASSVSDSRNYTGMLAEISVWSIDRSADLSHDANQRLFGDEVGLIGLWTTDAADLDVLRDVRGDNHGAVSGANQVATNDFSFSPGTESYKGMVLGADPEGQPLSYTLGVAPAHGVVVLDGNTFTYTPNELNAPANDHFSLAAVGSVTVLHDVFLHNTA